MTVIEITSAADYRKATNEDGVCVIDAYATWCGPCKQIAPLYEKMSKDHPNVRFYKFNIDDVPDVTQELGISTVPNFNIFKDGMIEDSVNGADAKKLEAKIKEYL